MRGYYERERWTLTEVPEFIRRELGERGWLLTGFFSCLLLMLVWGGYRLVEGVSLGQAWFSDIVLPFGLGVVLTLPLVVPHELIHGVGYRLSGARKLEYGGSLGAMMFYAVAPGHVVNVRQLSAIALAPFVIISGGLLLGLLWLQGFAWWVGYGTLLAHSQGCIGDFAMIGFFLRQERPSDWLTYDDEETKELVLLERDENRDAPESAADLS